MDLLRRLGGILARLGYSLARYRIGTIPLDLLAIIALFLVIPWEGWRGWQQGFTPLRLLIMAGSGVLAVALLILRFQHYVIYRCGFDETQPARVFRLPPDEKLSLWASGHFEVGGNRRYFVQIPAQFTATELGEYIVMAQLRHRFSLGLIKALSDEWGWWYIFIVPRMVRSMDSGRFYHGLSARPTIRIVYESLTGKESVVYLSFGDRQTRDLVAQELRQSLQT